MSPAPAALPNASVATVLGLLHHLEQVPGRREDVYKLGGPLGFELDDLLPVTEVAKRLGLVSVDGGDILLTGEGLRVAQADETVRKKRLRPRVGKLPVISRIRRGLVSGGNGRMARRDVVQGLGEHFSPAESDRQVETALEWARYVGLFDFDADAEEFVLPE